MHGARRKFPGLSVTSRKKVITEELRRIGELYAIECDAWQTTRRTKTCRHFASDSGAERRGHNLHPGRYRQTEWPRPRSLPASRLNRDYLTLPAKRRGQTCTPDGSGLRCLMTRPLPERNLQALALVKIRFLSAPQIACSAVSDAAAVATFFKAEALTGRHRSAPAVARVWPWNRDRRQN
jgi:hypothetical protein